MSSGLSAAVFTNNRQLISWPTHGKVNSRGAQSLCNSSNTCRADKELAPLVGQAPNKHCKLRSPCDQVIGRPSALNQATSAGEPGDTGVPAKKLARRTVGCRLR